MNKGPPEMHWAEHPQYFRDTITDYSSNNAVVFCKIDFMMVSMYLLSKRYDLLAKHVVNVGDRFDSDKEIVAYLKARVQRFGSVDKKHMLSIF